MIRKTLLVISLVLLVGTVGLWVRSLWVVDDVSWASSERAFHGLSGGCRVWFSYDGTPQPENSFMGFLYDASSPAYLEWSSLYRFKMHTFGSNGVYFEFPYVFPSCVLPSRRGPYIYPCRVRD